MCCIASSLGPVSSFSMLHVEMSEVATTLNFLACCPGIGDVPKLSSG